MGWFIPILFVLIVCVALIRDNADKKNDASLKALATLALLPTGGFFLLLCLSFIA